MNQEKENDKNIQVGKKIIFNFFRPINAFLLSFNGLFNILTRFFNLIYSSKYSVIFNCKYCSFLYPVNFVTGAKYFNISPYTIFGKFAVLTAYDGYANKEFSPCVTIGESCFFGDFIHITCINKITIGSGVLTGRWVTITDNGHGSSVEITQGVPPKDRDLTSKGAIIIDDNVWIGDKATILPNVHIGKNSIVAANSVVTKSVPENCVVAGIPAKIIKNFGL